MEYVNIVGLILGSSFASGVNLYMTLAGLGIAHRLHYIVLPGSMDVISHPLFITVAVILYLVEFVADKIPYVDSLWDTVHTAIRPIGGASLGYLAVAGAPPAVQASVALIAGTIAFDSHLTKATTRAVINTSPEPVSNSIASVSEDVAVFGMLTLMIKHPVIASIIVILFIIFSIWFLKKMFKFVKKIFSGKQQEKTTQKQEG